MRRSLHARIPELAGHIELDPHLPELPLQGLHGVQRLPHDPVQISEVLLDERQLDLQLFDPLLHVSSWDVGVVASSPGSPPRGTDDERRAGGCVLTWLSIRDLAVVQQLTLEPHPGLNVITGETGAGKSILIAAIKLALGGRGRADLVRAGADQLVVEAAFDLDRSPAMRERLCELLDEEADELIVRRVLKATGRSRAWVNGVMVPGTTLSQLVRGVVDICSQHEHDQLADASTHLSFLDAFAELSAGAHAMARTWQAYADASSALDALAEQVRARAEREAVVRMQLDEMDAVDPQPGEEDELDAELGRLSHADRLRQITAAAEDALYSGEDGAGARLARLSRQLEDVAGVDPALDVLAERLEDVRTSVEELGRDLGRYGRAVTVDPRRLAEVEERLGALRRLTRRFGGTPERLLSLRTALREELAGFDTLEDRLESLEAARHAALDEAIREARALSQARRAAARELGASITKELADLGMGDARVEVDVARREGAGRGPDVDGARLGPTGIDRVELLIAPNRGEPPRPLHRIASGGELSRSLLAIKRVLSRRAPRGLYVFDEVDTGVGGAVAEAIGRKLRAVADHQQVLCVTHQPQIAAYGHAHFHVSKASTRDRTHSTLTQLDDQGRHAELARMLGGIEVTEASHAAAADLLAAADRAFAAGR